MDTSISVSPNPNNEFNLPPGNQTVHTRNICAVIPSGQIANIKRISFGGSGGKISSSNPAPFNTKVIYDLI